MSNQLGTFNTIGSDSGSFGGSTHVWARVDRVIHGGRKINVSEMAAGTVIPAGTLVEYTYDSEYATIKTSSDSLAVGHHYGLVFNDVCVPGNCIFASCAIVISGVVWADAIDVAESQQTHMPGIEFIRNHMGSGIYAVTVTATHATVKYPQYVMTGSAFHATIKYDEGYQFDTVTVKMGSDTITKDAVNIATVKMGSDTITQDAVNIAGDEIDIDEVEGAITITVIPAESQSNEEVDPEEPVVPESQDPAQPGA